MRKLCLLIGMFLLLSCSSPEPEIIMLEVTQPFEEAQGAEQAARSTPLPPRDKSTPLALVNSPTVTQAITATEPISTTVRGDEQSTTVEQPRPAHSRCSAAAQHAIRSGD